MNFFAVSYGNMALIALLLYNIRLLYLRQNFERQQQLRVDLEAACRVLEPKDFDC